VCALNLPLSPENCDILEGADPFLLGAGNMGGATRTSAISSSRGLRQYRVRQRHRSNQASIGNPKGSWRNIPDREDSSRVWMADI